MVVGVPCQLVTHAPPQSPIRGASRGGASNMGLSRGCCRLRRDSHGIRSESFTYLGGTFTCSGGSRSWHYVVSRGLQDPTVPDESH